LRCFIYCVLSHPIFQLYFYFYERTLDAAKMNRAICLQRPEPREADLQSTGLAIVHASPTAASSTPEPARKSPPIATPAAPITSSLQEMVGGKGKGGKGGKGKGKGGAVNGGSSMPAAVVSSPESDSLPPPPPPSSTTTTPLVRSTSIPSEDLGAVLGPLAAAYHAVYSTQQSLRKLEQETGGGGDDDDGGGGGGGGRDFIGMRDYYAMLKMLRGDLLAAAARRNSERKEREESHKKWGVYKRREARNDNDNRAVIDPAVLDNALYRNFGGKPALLNATVNIFREKCFGNSLTSTSSFSPLSSSSAAVGGSQEGQQPPPLTPSQATPLSSLFPPLHRPPPSTLSLVQQNLADSGARHLMVLTRQGAALPLLVGAGVLRHRHCAVLVGSAFEEDRGELRLVQQINQVCFQIKWDQSIILIY
jgi:hypothetical protein